MKKSSIVFTIALVTLIIFGAVSSAGAFVDPVSIALIGVGVVAIAAIIGEKTKNNDTEKKLARNDSYEQKSGPSLVESSPSH